MFVKIWPQNYNIFFVSPNFFAKKCTFFHIFVHFFKNLCKFVQKIAPKLQNLSQQVAKSLRAHYAHPQLCRSAHKVGPAGGQRRPAQDRQHTPTAGTPRARNERGPFGVVGFCVMAFVVLAFVVAGFTHRPHGTAAQGTQRRNRLRWFFWR